jgi:hypothetical protein
MIASQQYPEIVAAYDYHNAEGVSIYQVVRLEPKSFRQRRPDGAGNYIWNLEGVVRVPYRLNDLRRRIAKAHTVFVTEGEKDADALDALKLCATTSAQGAAWKWPTAFLEHFRGAKRIVVLVDCDSPGRAAGFSRAEALSTVVEDVRILDLAPDRGDGFDVSDWLGAGHSADDLMQRAENAPQFATSVDVEAPIEDVRWDDSRPWPTLDEDALYGLAGDFVRLVAPHSEADLAALLAQFLCAFGCAAGPSAHVMVEATPHTARLNVLVIGETAGGRKGTAKDQVVNVFRIADDEWLDAAQISGLASGEGLIARLKDRDEGEPVEKRVLVVESEFARTLAAGSRDGSILGAIIRDAWDTGRLQQLTRKDPLVAKGCHVSIIGHITADELRSKLSSTDIANGFANRFIPVCAKRRQRLPHGGSLASADYAPIAKRLRAALDFARQVRAVRRTLAANVEWESFYNGVPEPQGLLGAVTARAEAQVLRLSLVYALLDQSPVIEAPHLRAAISTWNYAHASAEHVWGSKLGDDVADRILEAVRAKYPADCDREQLRAVFSRHVPSSRMTTAIEYLDRRGLISTKQIKTDGRPREVVRALPCAKSAISAESFPKSTLTALTALSAQPTEREYLDPPTSDEAYDRGAEDGSILL